MNAKALTFASIAVAFTLSSARILANNNLFLPGDAFFPTVLTKADIEALQATKSAERTFRYSSFGGYEGAFCGYAGYANAKIPSVDDAFAKSLASVYERIRESQPRELIERTHEGKTELIETNGVRVLFYPPEFEFPRYHLGLRYNEKWVTEAVKFGHERKHLRLCCLIPSPDAIECEWRDAELVPPLKVQLPKVELNPVPETETPVVVQGPVKAVVIGSYSLEDLFRDEAIYPMVYIVDAKGIIALLRDDSEWKEYRE